MKEILNKIENINFDIVFIAEIFLDKDNNYFNGGGEIHLKEMIHTIKSEKKILVIQKSDWDEYIENFNGFSVLKLKAKNRFFYRYRLAKILKQLKTKRFHFNYVNLLPIFTLFNKKKTNTTFSCTFHGVEWDFPIKDFPEPYIQNNLKMRFLVWILKQWHILELNNSIKFSDQMISVDTSLLRYTQQFLTEHRNKITTVYNFADTDKFKFTEWKGFGEKIKILYPRNISFARGVHLLVPIAKKLIQNNLNFEIQIVGDAIKEIKGDKYGNLLKKEIKKNNLTQYFNFIGRIKHENMPNEYSKTDIVLIPTFFSEGTSLSCLEAMSSGRIVVATNIGGLNDIVIDNFNSLLAKPTTKDITNKIIFTVKNEEKVFEMIKNSHNLIVELFNKEIWDKKIKKIFT